MTSLPITLPEGFTPVVAVDDRVTPGLVIARKEAPQDQVVNLFESLNVSRSQAKKLLKKGPGERISPGDVLAIKKSLFGKVKASIISSISGIIIRYERDTGNLVVRSDKDATGLELISPVAGIVTLCNNKEIVIKTDNAFVSTGVALGSTGEGTLFVLKESFDEGVTENALYYLDSRTEGKIVLVHTLGRDLVTKGDTIGVKGFLGTTIANEDISYFQEKGIKLPVIEIAQELVSHLHTWENKKIMVDIPTKAIMLLE